jgi:hypothetical protein
VPAPSSFDHAAVAFAARQFTDLLGPERRIERIEVTLSGRGPIERLFAVEAALLAQWPQALSRPAHDLVASTGELAPAAEQAALTLRAFSPGGAVVLQRIYDVRPRGRALAGQACD